MEGLCSNGQSLNEVKRRRSSRSSTVLAVRLPYASMCDVGWEYVIQLALGEQFVETCKQFADPRRGEGRCSGVMRGMRQRFDMGCRQNERLM